MACPQLEELARYAAGLAADIRTLITHVESCEPCRRIVVREVLARRPPPEPPVEAWLAAHRAVYRR